MAKTPALHFKDASRKQKVPMDPFSPQTGNAAPHLIPSQQPCSLLPVYNHTLVLSKQQRREKQKEGQIER